MVKKIPRQDENQPFDYFASERASQMQKAVPSENVVKKLRGDTLPSTVASPAKENIFLRLNLKIVLGVLLAIIIFGLIIFSAYGVGRQKLEASLFGLYGITKTPTIVYTRTPVGSVSDPTDTKLTPISTPTTKPTRAATRVVFSSPTFIQPSATSVIPVTPTQTTIATQPSACRDVGSITLSEVGQSLCVQGSVLELIPAQSGFMVIFNNEIGSFYWVTYDLVWSDGEVGKCYQVEGKIDQIGNSPVLVFNYGNLPVECP